METIVQKVGAQGSIDSLHNMRLVSKSWLEAYRSYAGYARLSMNCKADLAALSRTLPGIASLFASCPDIGFFRLDPLSQLSQLTCVQLTGRPYTSEDDCVIEPFIDLGSLPAALKILATQNLFADPDSFEKIRCTGLTRLSCSGDQNKADEIADLLVQLPDFKVASLLCNCKYTSFTFDHWQLPSKLCSFLCLP